MTPAQKKTQANFKKAIAYRQKNGCTLKEAFAHVKGGVVKGLDKVVKKGNKTTVLYTKKVAPKKQAAPKKKPIKKGKLFGVENTKNDTNIFYSKQRLNEIFDVIKKLKFYAESMTSYYMDIGNKKSTIIGFEYQGKFYLENNKLLASIDINKLPYIHKTYYEEALAHYNYFKK
jgi:hypothetical protein